MKTEDSGRSKRAGNLMTNVEEIANDGRQADGGLALWEIASVVTSCLIAEWVVLAFAGSGKIIAAIPITLALLFMIFSHLYRGERFPDIGFRLDNFIAAVRLLLLPTLVAIGLIL